VIVVVDTNVWISALQFAKGRGTPTLALEKAMSEDVIATCDEIDGEIVRVLTEKFSWEQHRATSALQAILARGIRVKIRGTVRFAVIQTTICFWSAPPLRKRICWLQGPKIC